MATLSIQTSREYALKTIMIIGSSMTQKAFDTENWGFGIGLSDWYNRTADIIVRGQSGYNTRWTLLGFNKLLGNYKPDLFVFFLGNNDSTRIDCRYISIDEYEKNMIEMIRISKTVNPHSKFILLTPTRADNAGRSDELTFQYADVIRKIGALDPDITVIDFWYGDISIVKEDLCDGLHLGQSGNQKVLLGLKMAIRKYLPQFVPFSDEGNVNQELSLKWLFPRWNIFYNKSLDESCEIIDSCR